MPVDNSWGDVSDQKREGRVGKQVIRLRTNTKYTGV